MIGKRWNGSTMGRKKKQKMNKKVYVLIGGCIDDKHVVAVFSSMKRAKEVRNEIISIDRYYSQYPEDLEIETFYLNGENIDAW